MATKDISDRQVVEAARSYTSLQDMDVIEILEAATGQHRKVCIAAMERADGRKLIEYGVSLRTVWPTPEGLALLELEHAP